MLTSSTRTQWSPVSPLPPPHTPHLNGFSLPTLTFYFVHACHVLCGGTADLEWPSFVFRMCWTEYVCAGGEVKSLEAEEMLS